MGPELMEEGVMKYKQLEPEKRLAGEMGILSVEYNGFVGTKWH